MGMSIDFRLYRFAALSFPQTHTTLPDNIATPFSLLCVSRSLIDAATVATAGWPLPEEEEVPNLRSRSNPSWEAAAASMADASIVALFPLDTIPW